MAKRTLSISLAAAFAAGGCMFIQFPKALAGEKSGSRLEEHYETLPPDVEPGKEDVAPDDQGLPEPDAQTSPNRRSSARQKMPPDNDTYGGDGNRDWNADGSFRGGARVEDRRARRFESLRSAEARDSQGDDIADVSYFFDALADGGTWTSHGQYGDVWRPNVPHDWRPYTEGRWVFSDDYGWTWISDEPFGWAVYHYGRWAFERASGWFWVPGTQWGPAWVAWRHGEEAIGWAPLPPEARFTRERIDFDPATLQGDRYDLSWVFVRPRYFARPEMRRYIRAQSWNAELVYRTEPRIGFDRFEESKRTRLFNRGLAPDEFERLARRPLTRVKVTPLDEPYLRKPARLQDGPERDRREFKIYKPDRSRTEAAIRKRDRGREKTQEQPAIKNDAQNSTTPAPATSSLDNAETSPRKAPEAESRKTEARPANSGLSTPGQDRPAASGSSKAGGGRHERLSAPLPTPATTGSTSDPAPGGNQPPEPASTRPSTGKKRWDGSGPSGAPSTDTERANAEQN